MLLHCTSCDYSLKTALKKAHHTIQLKESKEFDSTRFYCQEVKKYFLDLQGKTFIQEQGFDTSFNLCNDIYDIIYTNQWMDLCLTPKESAINSVVYKFYESLKYWENNKVPNVYYRHVIVREKEVLVTPEDIYQFYNAPYYLPDALVELDIYYFFEIDKDSIVNYLTERSGIWKCQPSMNIPLNFNQAITLLVLKMWMQFIYTCISLAFNVSNVNVFWVFFALLYFTMSTGLYQHVDL